ncbi:hypothetical protein F5X68DRAFT_276281 [Plectosphaerella plurivora]|uniref:Proteasome assembly chaperone 3 n=1 Tax=Plectosphaerella plurivora TaxID=936078 RepID=A0A9P9AB48_9PEZI|nr:hypothetical protein F5X68DRAFT_276281 [Plectosphaerella plurivora]
METSGAREEPFPAQTRQESGTVNGIPTEATSMYFSDKIVVTISQEGRLSQWVSVPLTSSAGAMVDMNLPRTGVGMLPSTHLTPRTLLGSGGDERETVGQLYATQIASFVALRDPEDRRTLVLGLGLLKPDTAREAFFDTIELVQKVL